jgi:hypothetical protein
MLFDHSTDTESPRDAGSSRLAHVTGDIWFIEQFSRSGCQSSAIANWHQESGYPIIHDLGKLGSMPANHRFARSHRLQSFFNPALRMCDEYRASQLHRYCSLPYTHCQTDPEVIERKCPAELFQSDGFSSSAENNQMQIRIVVAEHVERDDGIFWSDSTIGSTSGNEQPGIGRDTQALAKRIAVCLRSESRSRRANESQSLAGNSESPVTLTIDAGRCYHAIRAPDLAGYEPATKSSARRGGTGNDESRCIGTISRARDNKSRGPGREWTPGVNHCGFDLLYGLP